MKSLKAAFLSMVMIVMIAGVSQAQETPKKEGDTETQTAPATGEDAGKSFDSRMAKLQQAVSKMQAKVSKVKDPQMQADMNALIAKMKQISDDYAAMKNTTGMSEQQQEQLKKKIKTEMDEARKMHEDMKAKYGGQMGGKAKKESPEQQPPPPEEAPAPK